MKRKLSKWGGRAVVMALAISFILTVASVAFAKFPKPADFIDAKYIKEYAIPEYFVPDDKDWVRQQDWPAIKAKFAGTVIRHASEGVDIAAPLMFKDMFEELSGIKVEITGIPADVFFEKLMMEFLSGTRRYDAVEFYAEWLGCYAEPGFLYELSDFLKKWKVDIADFHPVYWKSYSLWDGKPYAFAYDADCHLLHWRKTLYDKAGLAGPPKTYDEVLANAKKLTMDTDGDGKIDIYGFGMPAGRGMWSFYYGQDILGAYGATLFTSDWRPGFNNPEGKAALKMFKELTEYSPPGVTGWNYAMCREAWLAGKMAQVMQWQCVGKQAHLAEMSRIWAEDVRHDVLPKGSGPKAKVAPALAAGSALGVTADAKNPEAAFLWLSFLNSAETQCIYSAAGTGVEPSHISSLTSPAFQRANPTVKAWLASLPVATAIPRIPEVNDLQISLGIAINEYLTGAMSLDNALVGAEKYWDRLMKKAGYYKPGVKPAPPFVVADW